MNCVVAAECQSQHPLPKSAEEEGGCICVRVCMCVYMRVCLQTHTMAFLWVPPAYDPTCIRGSGNIAESLMVFDVMEALLIRKGSFHS